MEAAPITSGIKRRVKDRIAKTKLNVSLASKIKTKILSKCHSSLTSLTFCLSEDFVHLLPFES